MFNLPNPGNNPANPFYSRIIAEQQRALQEAVTVDIEFKKDADGAAAIGSETGRRGLVVSGKKVKDKVYKITFTNNATMNKFMDKYENKLNEGTEELEEGTPEYRAMMKKYKGSDMEKVFKILDKEGFRMGEQSDTLVRNMLKKHRGNVKKAADQIMKDNPGMFDVNRMMMDHVEIDEDINESILGKLDKVLDKVESKLDRLARAYNNLPRNKAKLDRENKERMERVLKNFDNMVAELDRAYAHVDEEVQLDEAEVYKRPAKVSALGGQKFHAIVANNMIVAAGMTEKEAKKMRKFGQTVLELPGAKVGQKLREDVEQVDEMSARAHYNKMVAQGKVGRGGRLVTPIDRDRFPNREKEGLEGPFRSRKSGQVYYYDRKAGKYYDPLSDMFLQVKDVMETNVIDNIDDYLAEGND